MRDYTYFEGYEAFEDNTPLENNPYDSGSAEYDAWKLGWLTAETEHNTSARLQVIQMDDDIYREGYEAYLQGIARSENPHKQSADAWRWDYGWDQAEIADKDDPYMYGGKDGRP